MIAAILADGGEVQVGGGIREEAAISELLDAGAARVVVGTRALEDEAWLAAMARRFPHRIVVAVDARDGKVATHGWTRTHDRDAVGAVSALAALPLAGVLVTAVEREGRMAGPTWNFRSARRTPCRFRCTPPAASPMPRTCAPFGTAA